MNIEFCPECNTCLHLSEIDGELKNICKQCGNTNENTDDILYTVYYKTKEKQSNHNKKYIMYDSTQPRTNKIKCINDECSSHKKPETNEIVVHTLEHNQELKYICVNCKTEWGY